VHTGIEITSPSAAETQELYCLAKTAFGDSPGWDDERVLDTLHHDVLFMASEGRLPAGYVALGLEPDDREIVVEHLLVAPGHEHRGVGHRLLACAEEYAEASGAPALLIVVEPDNLPAQSFYRRSGFLQVEPELFRRVLPS
jgi:ribosomal protein S18 acetylase RimI-like enzyme